jgi:outer membrane protein TolC
MMQQGLVTRADLLQADVRATEVASQLVSARNDLRTAQRQFALLLGRTDDAPLLLPSALPDDSLLRAFAVRDTMAGPTATTVDARADVQAAQAAARSARADQRRAASTLLPRLNSFARYDWNSPTALYGGKPNWTIGVMASWSPFSGGSELADVAVTTARARTARAGEDATRAQARLEADISRRDLSVALERLDLAARAAEQSREAHRLVEKRYAGGLATIAELLGAEAIATGAALSRAAARFAVIDALAAHRRAVGADPAALAALEGTR